MLFFSSLFPYATSIVSVNFNNPTAQIFYGLIVIAITISNILTHQTLIKENASETQISTQIQHRNQWLLLDLLIKVIGLFLSFSFFPTAISYSVLIILLGLVIPNQIKFVRKNIERKN